MRVREHILRLSTDGGCFIGASLSCADLLVYLYANVLNLTPHTLAHPERDYLFLSKGHDVPALYGTLVELGFWGDPASGRERLRHHLHTTDAIYWHPNRALPGVEFHSGSLGHLLSVSMGVALDIKLRGQHNRVFVVLGDGELNEGSIWEALLVASAYKLDNLVVIVDRNGFQANIETELLIPLEPLEKKFEAFGCAALRIDGHSFASLSGAFAEFPVRKNQPSVVIADTVRGKGVPSIEAKADRWFVNFSAEEVEMLLKELHGGGGLDGSGAGGALTSEPLMVR